jgi:hypothetical protein
MADKSTVRGRSGYSKKDEDDARKYGQIERALSDDVRKKVVRGEKGFVMPKGEPEARQRSAEQNYLSNTKTERGRDVNKRNKEFLSKELADVNKHKWKGTV